ncbi:YegP family protein [Sphingomonas sp. DT-207]|uniref:YegP family protein n=1 Tax=Sphingomonas sp. DT-207 TaxID=3396167 RepID=UPI003F1D82DE
MAHKFVIEQNKAGEYVAKFKHHSEVIFWTEGYASKAGAKNAIESILKNGPGASVEEG